MLTLGLRHVRGKLSRPHCESHLLFRSTCSLCDFVYILIPSKTGPGAEMEVIFSMQKLYWVYLSNIHTPCHMGSLTVPSFLPLNLCAAIKKDFLLSVKHQAYFNISAFGMSSLLTSIHFFQLFVCLQPLLLSVLYSIDVLHEKSFLNYPKWKIEAPTQDTILPSAFSAFL